MKKVDLMAALIAALEQSSGDNIRPFLTGYLASAFDKGDKDARRIMVAIGKKDPYVAKYLAKSEADRGPLVDSEL